MSSSPVTRPLPSAGSPEKTWVHVQIASACGNRPSPSHWGPIISCVKTQWDVWCCLYAGCCNNFAGLFFCVWKHFISQTQQKICNICILSGTAIGTAPKFTTQGVWIYSLCRIVQLLFLWWLVIWQHILNANDKSPKHVPLCLYSPTVHKHPSC